MPTNVFQPVKVHCFCQPFSQTIDALDQNEDLTDLGFHLADLPVEPHLGKMVLCAVVLKCLDPILTIACTLAYRDPFTLPAESSQKRAALQSRKRFTSNTFSDHMALLRAFQVQMFAFFTTDAKSFSYSQLKIKYKGNTNKLTM